LFQERVEASGRPVADVMADALSQQSIPKMVDPADIGALCVFLASDSGKGISGQLLSIAQDTQSN
jgi:enoyl-[acyl-carrier-protein] reductase (NADH)